MDGIVPPPPPACESTVETIKDEHTDGNDPCGWPRFSFLLLFMVQKIESLKKIVSCFLFLQNNILWH